ncbi:MAG: hypothetical protein A2351_03145 [Omnitrophica bacterium RIFOXYB12_FULL_50_7]|nr:MAG: hypothetical protein A2351_03145 [Omnitrophica bacterium RIFOXYB12_FULL_50_7]
MEPQTDFKDLLALFNEHKVKYLIVGAYALAFHGVPRFTGDMDILVKPCSENAKKILRALNAFGFGSLGLAAADFEKSGQVIQLGVPPVRVDLITSLTGVSWEEAFSGKMPDHYGSVPVYYIGRKQFVVNKRKTRRKKDLADLEALGER